MAFFPKDSIVLISTVLTGASSGWIILFGRVTKDVDRPCSLVPCVEQAMDPTTRVLSDSQTKLNAFPTDVIFRLDARAARVASTEEVQFVRDLPKGLVARSPATLIRVDYLSFPPTQPQGSPTSQVPQGLSGLPSLSLYNISSSDVRFNPDVPNTWWADVTRPSDALALSDSIYTHHILKLKGAKKDGIGHDEKELLRNKRLFEPFIRLRVFVSALILSVEKETSFSLRVQAAFKDFDQELELNLQEIRKSATEREIFAEVRDDNLLSQHAQDHEKRFRDKVHAKNEARLLRGGSSKN